MYLRCDGVLVLNGDNTYSCDNWALTTTADIALEIQQTNQLPANDFYLLGETTIGLMHLAFSVKLIRELLLDKQRN